MATQRLASASHSNIGKSTTHSGCQPPALSFRSCPIFRRSAPSASLTTLARVGAEEDEVVVGGLRALEDAAERRIAQELDDGRLQPLAPLGALVDLDVREPLGAVARHVRGALIDLRARQAAAAGHPQRRDPAVGVARRTCEHLEVAVPAPGPRRRRARGGCAGPACRSRSGAWPRRRSCAGRARAARLVSTSRKKCRTRASMRPMISSWARKEVSTSSWVNSGWRSARRSSSRKQRTIW